MNAVGRNHKCPCGSNRKYKKCCLSKDEANRNIRGVLTKSYDIKEGDDFFGRFIFQMCQIRDCISPREERLTYDHFYSTIFENLYEAKIARERCLEAISQHNQDVANGKGAYITNRQITVDAPITDDLNLFFKDFFIRGVMASDALFRHCAYMGYPISGLFSDKEKKRKQAVAEFPIPDSDPRKAQFFKYIEGHQKNWYRVFRELRVQIIHHGWKLPKIVYSPIAGNKVGVNYPKIHGLTIEEILNVCWHNMTGFCEETIVILAGLKLPDDLMILEIPIDKRDKGFPVRFAVRHKAFPEANFSSS